MSKANKPAKVLRTALKRVQKGWTKGMWSDTFKDKDGRVTAKVCQEGAIFGYTNTCSTPAQREAHDILLQVIQEKYPDFDTIPAFNDDPQTTQEMVEEVMKTALIRAETGGLLRCDEVENLL